MTDDAEGSWAALPGWSDAQRGLRTCFHAMVAFCIFIGGALLSVIFGVSIIASEGADAASDFMAFIQIYSTLGWLAVLGIILPGLARWRRLPAMTGAAGLATASLWLSAVYAAIALITFVAAVPTLGDVAAAQRTSTFQNVLGVIVSIIMAAGVISFQASLARAAGHVGRADLAALARRTLTVTIIVMALGLAVTLVSQGMQNTDPMSARGAIGLVGILGLAAMGLGIWALVDIMRTIAKLRAAIVREVAIVGEF